MTEQELFRGLYQPANFFERFTHRKTRYLLATQAIVTEMLPDGNGIYHGLAGQFLFADLCNAFKVRIVAPDGVQARDRDAPTQPHAGRGAAPYQGRRRTPLAVEPADLQRRYQRPRAL